jgi:ABC-type amino acid transport system permease subunit
MERGQPHLILLQSAIAAEKAFTLVQTWERIRLTIVVREVEVGFSWATAVMTLRVVPTAPTEAAFLCAFVSSTIRRTPLLVVLFIIGLKLLRARDALVMRVQAVVHGWVLVGHY